MGLFDPESFFPQNLKTLMRSTSDKARNNAKAPPISPT